MIFLFVFGFSIEPARAGDFKVHMDYACIVGDGIPIPRHSVLATKCCYGNGANEPVCNSGFFSILPDTLVETENVLDGAYQLIDDAITLTGATSDLNAAPEGSPDPGESPSSSSGTISAESSALLSGGQIPIPGGRNALTGASPTQNLSSGQSSTGLGGLFSSSGPSGMGIGGLDGGSSGKKIKKRGTGSSTEDFAFSTGKYASLGSGRTEAPTSVGPSEVVSGQNVEVIEYGSGRSEGASGSGGNLSSNSADSDSRSGSLNGAEQNPASDESEGEAESLADQEGEGSPKDAADYLKRIHKKDSIFKIVSKRYAKEESRKHIGASRNRPTKR
ncbi:MAG: hypothetical protein KGP28_00755 [Bdellovibrionales bacterium]|nr:hypothetical protein [Bdellovibrionales bacterium]